MSHSPDKKEGAPLTIGVFGGSFNPIHLGHALLAITVQQTKAVDQVVLVPVYKHAVKRDLLPFEDRVTMCEHAVAGNVNITVSRAEQRVGASNGAMLRELRSEYPVGTKFLWICGDDFFRWMDRPKGLETLAEVSGMIVQRRLHRTNDGSFYKDPIDTLKVQSVTAKLGLEVDYIYGELPHFSSTLVRQAPDNWRSFLTQSVVNFLERKPELLQQLIHSLESAEDQSERSSANSGTPAVEPSSVVLRGLDVIHALQYERGLTGLRLSTNDDSHRKRLQRAQAATDRFLSMPIHENAIDRDLYEVRSLAAELKRIPVWLTWDRDVLEQRAAALCMEEDGWLARSSIVDKFAARIDVLIGSTVRALAEILPSQSTKAQLLRKWCDGKEALGRLRAFVSAGGPRVPDMLQSSLSLRERLCGVVANKDRQIQLVISSISSEEDQLGRSRLLTVPDALYQMLEDVTLSEYKILGSFAGSTPLPLVHKLIAANRNGTGHSLFDVEEFFEASTAALDFFLSFSKALAASACATEELDDSPVSG